MMKFELLQYGEDQELLLKSSDGDIRYKDFGSIERYQAGAWTYIGNIDDLFRDFEINKIQIANLNNWMLEQQEKDRVELIGDNLEEQFEDLAKAGKHLRQLEKMLRIARKTYKSMSAEVQARLKTFERLDTPYPDDEPA